MRWQAARQLLRWGWVALLLGQPMALWAVQPQPPRGEDLTVALVPEKNIFAQRKRYGVLTDYLACRLGMRVQPVFLETYADICTAFEKGRVDAGFFGSYSYALTHAGSGIIPVARPVWPDGSATYCGYLFVRKDSGIRTVADMQAKHLVLVDKLTTAGYVFQRMYLRERGIDDPEAYFSKVTFAGSHDNAAWAVFTGEADIGG